MTHEPEHPEWDRSQWAEEGNAEPSKAPDDATWDRHQMETDDPADGDDVGDHRHAAEPTADDHDARDPKLADDAGPLSGHGESGGEGHWERTDEG